MKNGTWTLAPTLMWTTEDWGFNPQIWEKVNLYSLVKDNKIYGLHYSNEFLVEGEQVEFEYEGIKVDDSHIENLFDQLMND
jgi:hypothetical protein